MRSLDLLGISARGSDAAQAPQIEGGCSDVTGLVQPTDLIVLNAMGTDASPPQRAGVGYPRRPRGRRLFRARLWGNLSDGAAEDGGLPGELG